MNNDIELKRDNVTKNLTNLHNESFNSVTSIIITAITTRWLVYVASKKSEKRIQNFGPKVLTKQT